MNRLLLSGLVGGLLAPFLAAAQPVPTYINPSYGIVTTPPHIDAISFINYGIFGSATAPIISEPQPYETFDTLNYTNYGSMYGIFGFRFDNNSTATGKRGMAANFVNLNPGVIEAADTANSGSSLNAPCAVAPLFPSYLYISATNIVSGGGAPAQGVSLKVGANGVMDLTGHKVDLSYSGLEVTPTWAEAIGTTLIGGTPPTNFIPDLGIIDAYWVQDNFSDAYALGIRGLWDGTVATAQPTPGPPNGPTQPTAGPGFSLFNPYASANVSYEILPVQITNSAGEPTVAFILSNVVKQAIFVGVPPGFNPQMGFGAFGSFPALNPFLSMGVLLTTTISNAVTGTTEPAAFGFEDELASDTRLRGLSVNAIGCGAATARPANYIAARGNVGIGFQGNFGYPDPGFFVNSSQVDTNVSYDSITNYVLTAGPYAGYGFLVDNMVSRPAAVTGGTATNLPGRIHINADILDLTQTRMRGEGQIVIDTPHLVSSTNAVIDCENLSFDLGSTNGNLMVKSMVPGAVVARLRGNVYAWSAQWSNTVTVIIDNYTITNVVSGDTNNPVTNAVPIYSPITNNFGVGYCTLMLDAQALTVTVPVSVYDLALHSLNSTVDDNMSLVQSLLIDSRSFTLNGGITIPGIYPPNPVTGVVPPIQPLDSWIATNAPNLLYFTNNGTLSIVNEAHFGDDRPQYSAFVNSGTIGAASLAINSYYLQSGGSLVAQGPLFVQANSVKLENGTAKAGTIAQFNCQNLKLNNYQLNSGNGALNLSVTNTLSDAGPSSGNLIQVRDGFNLMIKPQTGDLLGTTIETIAPSGPTGRSRISHTWAGEDRGPTPAGYLNNAAVGTLQFTAQNTDSLFIFSGAGAQNALYVDMLDLTALGTNFLNELQINPNLTIYYAAARLSPDVALPPFTEPEEYLDGKFGGHLRWVSNFAGPNSSESVLVLVNGLTNSISANSALRNSQILDSNGNGLVNANDPFPFVAAAPTVQINGQGSVSPDYDGQYLLVGQTYAMTAQAADGFTFTGWTGSVTSSSPVVTFTMTTNVSLAANFSFGLSPGNYSGLFYEPQPAGIELLRSGAITVTTTKGGRYSGSLQTANQRYSFTGELDTNGFDSITIPKSSLTLQLQVGNEHITGTVSAGTNWSASIQGDRAVFNRTNQASFAGKYTLIFPGTANSADAQNPQGDGYAAVTVDKMGRLKLQGALADGTKVTQTATVSGDGQWPLFIPLYKGMGQLLSWQAFEDTGSQDVGGLFDWIKQPGAKAPAYTNGFNYSANAVGSVYDASKKPVTGYTNGVLVLFGGNLADGITNTVTFDAKGRATVSDGKKQSLKLNPSQGLFSGKVLDSNQKPVNFNGAILQKQTVGSGFFLGPNQSGNVLLGP